jgi:hypothetical protein
MNENALPRYRSNRRMTLVATFLMPLIMLALLFFLAYIEDRHLTVRTRVSERGVPDTGPSAAPRPK